MGIVYNTEKSLILNETMMTLHKPELGLDESQTVCEHLNHVGQKITNNQSPRCSERR